MWPGDPPVVVEPVTRVEDGGAAGVSRLALGTHTGTHVDPPAHFVAGGATVDALPLDVLVGPAVVGDLCAGGAIGPDRLDALRLPSGTVRLLLKTRGGTNGEPPATAPGESGIAPTGALTPEGASWLVDRGIRLVGADTLSIEAANDDYPVHRLLLGAGVVIVEGLDLRAVNPGPYRLVCLPLRVAGGDGAPARAVLMPPGEGAT